MSYFPLRNFFEAWYLCRICVNSRIKKNVGFYCTLDGKRYEYFAYCPSFKVFKPRCDKLTQNLQKDFQTRIFLVIYIIAIISFYLDSAIFAIIAYLISGSIAGIYIYKTPKFALKFDWFSYLYVITIKYAIENTYYELFQTNFIIKQQIYKLYGYKTMNSFTEIFKKNIPDLKQHINKYLHKLDEKQRKRIFALVCQVCAYNNLENFKKIGIVEQIHQLLKLNNDVLEEIKDFFIEKEQELQNQQNTSYDENSQKHNSKIISENNDEKYFEILGLTSKASNTEISKKFRQLALLHHPDRYIEKSISEQQKAQEKFKEITNAYNEIKKIRYIN